MNTYRVTVTRLTRTTGHIVVKAKDYREARLRAQDMANGLTAPPAIAESLITDAVTSVGSWAYVQGGSLRLEDE